MGTRFLSAVTLSFVAVASVGLFFIPTTTHAQDVAAEYRDIQQQGLIFAGVCSAPKPANCACRDQGRCDLEDVLQVAVNVSVLIMAVSGSILLLLFMYGGFMWLTSGGNPERVRAGKKTIVGAVIGIVIIFGAYTAVTVLISVLRTGELPEGKTLEEVIEEKVCSEEIPGGGYWGCTTDADCLDWLSYNIDLGTCVFKNEVQIIETAQ